VISRKLYASHSLWSLKDLFCLPLQLFVRSKSDFGEYKCKAKNELGEVHHIIQLQEGVKPESPRKFELRGFSSNTLDIDVGARKDPKSTNLMVICGYRFEVIPKKEWKLHNRSWETAWVKEFAVEDGATYLLTPLEADTSYMVRVASRNIAGLSDWSHNIEVTTLLKQPHALSGACRSANVLSLLAIAASSLLMIPIMKF